MYRQTLYHAHRNKMNAMIKELRDRKAKEKQEKKD